MSRLLSVSLDILDSFLKESGINSNKFLQDWLVLNFYKSFDCSHIGQHEDLELGSVQFEKLQGTDLAENGYMKVINNGVDQ
jgi:hypothetical protein